MTQFMMIFRSTPLANVQLSPEQIQASIQTWTEWIGNLAAQGNFVSTNRIGFEGKTVKPNNIITEGPYAEVKEVVGGYMLVKANSLDEAVELAQGCPILKIGGHVEVRNIMALN